MCADISNQFYNPRPPPNHDKFQDLSHLDTYTGSNAGGGPVPSTEIDFEAVRSNIQNSLHGTSALNSE